MNFIKKAYDEIIFIVKDLGRYNVTSAAAASAFFVFLSLVPILLLISSILPYTSLSQADVLSFSSSFIPGSAKKLIEVIINDVFERSAATVSFSIIAIIWSASKAFFSLIRGLNTIHGVYGQRGYLVVRLRACVYTIIFPIVFIFTLLLLVFGRNIADFTISVWSESEVFFDVIIKFRFLFTLLMLTLFFASIYKWAPNKKLRFRSQLPGALFAAIAWEIFSYGFSVYFSYVNEFSIYGSLTTIIFTLMWMYFCIYIFITGAYLNKYLEDKSLHAVK